MSEFVTRREFEHWRNVAAFFYIGLALVCVLSIAGAVRDLKDTSKERLRAATEQTCVRGNIVRGYLIVDVGRSLKDPASRQRTTRHLLPILNCAPLLKGRPPVPMESADADAYITDLALRMGVTDWER